MTDEYFYIEEVRENISDVDNRKSKPNSEKPRNCNGIGDNSDVKGKKSQEIRLHEMEQQLEKAESRCNKLKGEVNYMKMLYNKLSTETPDPPKPVTKLRQTLHQPRISAEVVPPKRKPTMKDIIAEMKRKGVKHRTRNDAAWTDVPEKENTSNICALPQHETINTNAVVTLATAVGRRGDSSNKTAKSINNIISGITNSVNRLTTQFQANIGSTNTLSKHDAIPLGIQDIKCIPRDQTAAEKPYQTDPKPIPTEQSIGSQKSKFNKKNKSRPTIVSSKLVSYKAGSASSINDAKKQVKSAIKSVEKTLKLPLPNGSGDNEQVSLAKYKRKLTGKFKSSRSIITKKSYSKEIKTTGLPEKEDVRSDKLIELYHNSAAKVMTDSDDNITGQNKSHKAGPSRSKHTSHANHSNKQSREGNYAENHDNMEQYQNPLPPINEQEPNREGSYCRSYYLPTIASKMKQVAASYYENFNFRTIPFIAAKSTSPSHNLGVNIQQVLSIIKGRNTMAGISPTLAYNIELAAAKLGSRPLSAFVSNLGSRMVRNACPLNRRSHNYNHLQEMARDIPEETMEEMVNIDEEEIQDVQEQDWAGDSKTRSEKCTCVSKSGVKFNDVYSKYVVEDQPKPRQCAPPVRRIRKPWNPGGKYKDEMQRKNMERAKDIAKREQSLKTVLKNLHDEFADLNVRYDGLKLEVYNGNGNQDIILELEKLEKELQHKEEEITMVMSLYKEVLHLKQQVRVLKKRASQSTVVVSPLHRYHEYREHNATSHLTSLLRHIQQFQDTLKNKPNM